MAFDFPNSPTVGQTYSPGAGLPSYQWDGVKWTALGLQPQFPSGTTLLFYQASAPTGWTKLTTQNDKALRVVSGSGGVAGGTNPFSTVMAQSATANYTLLSADIPSHFHPSPSGYQFLLNFADGHSNGSTSPASAFYNVGVSAGANGATNTSSTGGGGAHSHGITMAVQYCDIILASKN
jgi:hypothetical protein